MFRGWTTVGARGGFAVDGSVKDAERGDSDDEADEQAEEREADFLLGEVVDGQEDVGVGAEEGEHHGEGEAGVDGKESYQWLRIVSLV